MPPREDPDRISALARRVRALEEHDREDMTGRYKALVAENSERATRLWGIAKLLIGIVAGALAHYLLNRH